MASWGFLRAWHPVSRELGECLLPLMIESWKSHMSFVMWSQDTWIKRGKVRLRQPSPMAFWLGLRGFLEYKTFSTNAGKALGKPEWAGYLLNPGSGGISSHTAWRACWVGDSIGTPLKNKFPHRCFLCAGMCSWNTNSRCKSSKQCEGRSISCFFITESQDLVLWLVHS